MNLLQHLTLAMGVREGFLEVVTFILKDELFFKTNKQAVTYASAGKLKKVSVKCCLNIYLSHHCGQYAKSYRKIK